jgi:succinylglutamate desuccinylase
LYNLIGVCYHCPLMEQRIIGRFGDGQEGPLLIAIGGIHGNEPAGVLAIKEVLRLLNKEKTDFPDFSYTGSFLGIKGNLEALHQKKRFIDRDLNRMMTLDEINHFREKPASLLLPDERECLELLDTIQWVVSEVQPSLTLILDLHTTTAFGGIFAIAAEDEMSISLAKGLHIPVILGIASGLKGTTLDYFNHPSKNVHCVVFEAGQHDDPQSIDRTVSAIINCMRALHSVDPAHVDHRHDGLLKSLGENLPKVTRLIHHYKILPGEKFKMKEGFKNFDAVRQGDLLATNENGPIRSPADALMLMPKYQPLGDDGFFLVKEVDEN